MDLKLENKAIIVKDLKKTITTGITLRKKEIIKGISFEIEKNSVFWFLWPNWAGKTTTIKTLLGLLKPTEGSIVINTSDLKKDFREKIGFMPENTWLYKYMTGIQFLKMNWMFYNKNTGKDFEKRSEEILKKVKLWHAKDQNLTTYSKGMLQRINLAQAILHDPEILFFDEPMSWLDPIWRVMVKDIIKELKEQGKTIFMNSHILNDVQDLCDSFCIINKGEIIDSWKINEKLENGITLESYFIDKILQHDKDAFERVI